MNQGNPTRAGKAPKRPWRYGLRDIAKATGKTNLATSRDYNRRKYIYGDLVSIAYYIVSTLEKARRRAEKQARRKARTLPVAI